MICSAHDIIFPNKKNVYHKYTTVEACYNSNLNPLKLFFLLCMHIRHPPFLYIPKFSLFRHNTSISGLVTLDRIHGIFISIQNSDKRLIDNKSVIVINSGQPEDICTSIGPRGKMASSFCGQRIHIC